MNSMSGNTAKKIWEFSEEEFDDMNSRAGRFQEENRGEGVGNDRNKCFCHEKHVLKVGAGDVDPHLISLTEPASPQVEKFRTLRYHVEKIQNREGGCATAITSSIAGDGKSITAINLAGTLAHNRNHSVLLLELDLHQPGNSLRDYLGLKKLKGAGVVDWIQNPDLSLEQANYYLPNFNLHIMPSGSRAKEPYELINSPRMGKLIKAVRSRFDFVIIDTAPAALVTESRILSKWIDGFLVVVSADVTPREMLEEALNSMEPDKVAGIVFNRYNSSRDKYYGYY